MDMKNTTEKNKLFAEFMELRKKKMAKGMPEYQYYHKFGEDGFYMWENEYALKFHYSWNWLMPVVSKIRSIVQDSSMYETEGFQDLINEMAEGCADVNVLQTYNAALKFIKWYNS